MEQVFDNLAPWIAAQWFEASEAVAVALARGEVEHDAKICALAAAVLLLIAVARAGVRHLPKVAQRAAFAALWPVALVALLAAAKTSYGHQIRVEAVRVAVQIVNGPDAAGRRRAVQPPAPAMAGTRQSAPKAQTAAAPPQTSAPTAMQAPEPAPPAMARAAPDAATLPPATPAPTVAQSAANTLARVASVLRRKAEGLRESNGLPILFGTDRVTDAAAAGGDYTAERSGRLTFGRARVTGTVPGDKAPAVDEVAQLSMADAGKALHLAAAGARRDAGRALIYVHGLNTSFRAAMLEAARIATAARFDGPVLVYSWPSAGHVLQYAYDAQSAADAVPRVAEFVDFVRRQEGVTSLSIVADGLGAPAVLDALALPGSKDRTPGAAPIESLALRAPDMDEARFSERIGQVRPLFGKLTLYAAASDRALNVSRRYVGAAPRAGDVPAGGPIMLDGVETVDITEAQFDPKAARGSLIIPAPIAVLGQWLRGAPAAQGAGLLEAVRTPRGTYWRLPAGR